MNDATLHYFRRLAEALCPSGNWEWVGRYSSQHITGLTRERAEEYARLYGGVARQEPDYEALVAARAAGEE